MQMLKKHQKENEFLQYVVGVERIIHRICVHIQKPSGKITTVPIVAEEDIQKQYVNHNHRRKSKPQQRIRHYPIYFIYRHQMVCSQFILVKKEGGHLMETNKSST